jgi:hypothetical protein
MAKVRGLTMKVSIYSREAAERLLREGFPDNTAVISFYNPPNRRGSVSVIDKPVDYSAGTSRVFQIALNDIDISVLGDLSLTPETFFTEAEELAEFIYAAKNDGLDIICQCEYGQSRSAGCAAAIREHFNGDGIQVFADYRYYPNQLVYNKVFAALEKHQKYGTGRFYYHASEEYIKTQFETLEGFGGLDVSLNGRENCIRAKERIEAFLFSKNLLCRSWEQVVEGFIGKTPFEFIAVKMKLTDAQYNGPSAPMTLFSEVKYFGETIQIMLWLSRVMADRRRGPPRKIHVDYGGSAEFEVLGKMIWQPEKKRIILVPLIISY